MPAAELGEHHPRTHPRGGVLDPLDDLDRPRRLQLVEDEVDEGWAHGRTALTASVARAFQGDLDPGARGGRDIGAPVEHLGDGRDRHPGVFRDRRDRDLGAGRLARHGALLFASFESDASTPRTSPYCHPSVTVPRPFMLDIGEMRVIWATAKLIGAGAETIGACRATTTLQRMTRRPN